MSATQAKVLFQELRAGLKLAGVQIRDAVLVHVSNSIYCPIPVLRVTRCGIIYTEYIH